MSRAGLPVGASQPRRPVPVLAIVAGVLALVALGALVWLIAFRPSGPEYVTPTKIGAFPTLAPSLVPTNTSTPLPTPTNTATPTPTVTPSPTATLPPEIGGLTVQTQDGQPLSRTTSNIELIVDASGSMLAQLGNRRRIDVARDAISALISNLPEDTNVGLRAYGHRAGDCTDVELLQPIAPLDRQALIAQVQAIQPKASARTPIGLSLEQVAGDLQGIQGDVLVVLVSDGEETCDANPVAVAGKLHTDNPRLRVAVVGFNIDAPEARANLSAIAESGAGPYFDASNAGQLTDALRQAISLSFRVIDSAGKEVYAGQLGTTANIPAGTYKVVIGDEEPVEVDQVVVTGGTVTSVTVSEKNGALNAEVAGQ
jgi:hypothetical protein